MEGKLAGCLDLPLSLLLAMSLASAQAGSTSRKSGGYLPAGERIALSASLSIG
jgi:hypothetical protein